MPKIYTKDRKEKKAIAFGKAKNVVYDYFRSFEKGKPLSSQDVYIACQEKIGGPTHWTATVLLQLCRMGLLVCLKKGKNRWEPGIYALSDLTVDKVPSYTYKKVGSKLIKGTVRFPRGPKNPYKAYILKRKQVKDSQKIL